MSDKKTESAKPEGEAKPAGQEAGGQPGGIKAFLPLIVVIILMPVLAFVTTKFLVLPKVVAARGGAEHEDGGHSETGAESAHGGGKEESAAKDHKEPGKEHGATKDTKDSGSKAGKKKQNVPISKVIVNVAGSMGTRYLMTSFTLVGTHNDFKTVIEENKDQLLDLANTAMASKTISELEKPGARNQLRAELISIFNNALGNGLVQEIYFTEFAVQ